MRAAAAGPRTPDAPSHVRSWQAAIITLRI